ncbi:MAG: hypothetical protein KatS3mg051_1907 [Anaerolineae bacterium]|nr:MAG: hypothetical protein KatS3mg051_1907 [Anaerolineae bacterium]
MDTSLNDAASELFQKRPEQQAELCRREYRRARAETLHMLRLRKEYQAGRISRSEMESSLSSSTWSDVDTRPERSSSSQEAPGAALRPVTVLPQDSPLVRAASHGEIKAALTSLGFSTGHVVSSQRADIMAGDMARAGWTAAELDLARALIPGDAELMKEISYSRTINTGVFAMARQRPEVKRGRLFTYMEAVEYAREHYQPTGDETERSGVGKLFDVVRVEGDTDTPWWMLK